MHDEHHAPGFGHNAQSTVQWQTPHLPHEHTHESGEGEADLDLVEAAFVEGFETASDPTSFLRLARIPFKTSYHGEALDLIRVDLQSKTDMASVTPLLGGRGHRVAPLQASHVAKRRRLRFTYLGPSGQIALSLAQVRQLEDETPQR